MKIMLDRKDDFKIEINEYCQFSLYDKDGNATHYQCTGWMHEPMFSGNYASNRQEWARVIEAWVINKLTVETPEEKIAKEAVKKAEESLKAAKETLKAVKDKK